MHRHLGAMTATRLFTRAIVRVSPQDQDEDVAEFLQGLVTHDVKGALPVWAGLLTPQGKALFDFVVWPSNRDLLLDCEAAAADALVKRLSIYRLRRRIAITRDDAVAVHWRPHEGDGAAADPRLFALGERWLAPVETTDESADEEWRAHRLALGVTEGQAELGNDATLWLECNAGELNGVSFGKGCYVGQENTARMNWRQKVGRRLVVVRAEADPGDAANAWYPALGLAVERRRVETIADDPAVILPDWLREALA
jgi:folate-binding protein YgfZ